MIGIKVALRTLAKTPFISVVAVLSLALGVGANAAIFSIFDQMLLQPLPVQEPDRLVNLSAPGPKPGSTQCGRQGPCNDVFSYPMFRDLQRADTGFSDLAAHFAFGANLALGGETTSGSGLVVSGSYFPVLGVRPALGRLLGPEDDRTIGEHFVVVLGHGYWESRMGADPGVLNETMTVNGQPMTIVGVAPAGFESTTLGYEPDVYVPITMHGVMSTWFDGFENRRHYWAYLFGRLDDGVSIERANERINTVYGAIINDVEAPLQEGMSEPTLERFRAKRVVLTDGARGQSNLQGEAGAPLILLLSITGVVLLIACANIANLLLVRGATRDREMAIRGSIGASRWQLLRQLLTEASLLAVIGAAAGLLVARGILSGLVWMMPADDMQAAIDPQLSGSMVGFAGLLAVGTGLLFGLYPALHATRSDLTGTLRSSAGQASDGRSASRFRSALVVGQLAMSMALLVAAGLFIRSLVNVTRVELGLQPENLVTFSLAPVLNGYEPERSQALFLQVEEALEALPGVTQATASLVAALSGNSWGSSVSVEGFDAGPDTDTNSRYNEVGPGYFRALGISLLAGREFTDADTGDSARVAIVNEAFADKFNLGGPAAVGKRMASGRSDELDIEIVGVIQDAKYSDVKQAAPPQFFTPYRQDADLGWLTFYVRAEGDSDAVLRAIPGVVERFDPNLPVANLQPMETQIRQNTAGDRVISMLSAAFAIIATVLAAIGLYGVLAFTVAQRTREIGVRIALGADAPTVRGMVLRHVGKLTAVGGAIGVVLALALGRGAQSLLFEIDGHDPIVVGLVVLLLSGIALTAGYLPARRAARVDPMKALRNE